MTQPAPVAAATTTTRPPTRRGARPKRLPPRFTFASFQRFVSALPDDRYRTLAYLLYGAGLRVGEVCHTRQRGGLRVGDYDYRDGIVSVTGKGSKQRFVPVARAARAKLDPWAQERERADGRDAPMFPSREGGLVNITARSVQRIWAEAGRRAGLGRVWPHLLRHGFATGLLKGGADIRYIQDLLGHASVETTQVYTRVEIGDLVRVVAESHPLS